ncbi:SDR family oxidoreductase [candidate division KSB3 bacterium]|uniref:SDR family oxidoreductase n=1 Tax=candidate division KSB3 bacterium TaxID=2044937 RepID=A0A9D5JS89_9BACT|nr:SDR family oxidoreductase [candidate division KSB3 bacterium]
MRDLFSLEGKIALVTGGSVGIGAMIAEGFVNFGAKVYLVARREEVLKKTQEKLRKIGPCEYIAADIGSVAGIKDLARAYGEREQSLDILVNNAGISDGGKEIEEVTEDTWDAVMDLNLKSIFFMTQAFLPFLRVGASPDTPSNVINIASIDGCGKLNAWYNYTYGASKAGVIQLGRHLGDSLAWEGIQINTISPGDFPTDLNTVARDHTDEMRQVIPGKRVGEKENLAGAAIFLASRAGNFNVGSNIVVDGGESVRGIQRAFYAKMWPDWVKLDR